MERKKEMLISSDDFLNKLFKLVNEELCFFHDFDSVLYESCELFFSLIFLF